MIATSGPLRREGRWAWVGGNKEFGKKDLQIYLHLQKNPYLLDWIFFFSMVVVVIGVGMEVWVS